MGPAEDETGRIARDWLMKAGKRWRPFLTACAYLALRDDPQAAIGDEVRRAAVAVECFHKASLIHDDIEDADETRYGDAALHETHGEAVALNVGDYLLGEGYRLLAAIDAPAEAKVEMLRAAAEGHRTLTEGQGAELLLGEGAEDADLAAGARHLPPQDRAGLRGRAARRRRARRRERGRARRVRASTARRSASPTRSATTSTT